MLVDHHLVLPAPLPAEWHEVPAPAPGQRAFKRTGRLSVIISTALHDDGRRWLHVSLSRPNQMPSYADLDLVKRVFIGPDRYAYQVFPPRDHHVNLHPYCLHLWACLDVPRGQVLPEFSRGLGSI